MVEALEANQRVDLRGFGTLVVKQKKERQAILIDCHRRGARRSSDPALSLDSHARPQLVFGRRL